MTQSLFFSAIAKFTLGVFLIGALLFLPAGTLHYPQGWLLMGILFIPMFLAYLFIIVKRIRNEEEVLLHELPGYAEYRQKVKWRLVPFVW